MNTLKPEKKRRPGNGRGSKYRNRRIHTVHGWFDSKGELQRWLFLLDAEKRGVVANLKRQVEFPLFVNETLVCTYVADYVYDAVVWHKTTSDHEFSHLQPIVEDFKGFITDEFKLKAKLFRAVMGFPIRVVKVVTEDPCKVDNS